MRLGKWFFIESNRSIMSTTTYGVGITNTRLEVLCGFPLQWNNILRDRKSVVYGKDGLRLGKWFFNESNRSIMSTTTYGVGITNTRLEVLCGFPLQLNNILITKSFQSLSNDDMRLGKWFFNESNRSIMSTTSYGVGITNTRLEVLCGFPLQWNNILRPKSFQSLSNDGMRLGKWFFNESNRSIMSTTSYGVGITNTRLEVLCGFPLQWNNILRPKSFQLLSNDGMRLGKWFFNESNRSIMSTTTYGVGITNTCLEVLCGFAPQWNNILRPKSFRSEESHVMRLGKWFFNESNRSIMSTTTYGVGITNTCLEVLCGFAPQWNNILRPKSFQSLSNDGMRLGKWFFNESNRSIMSTTTYGRGITNTCLEVLCGFAPQRNNIWRPKSFQSLSNDAMRLGKWFFNESNRSIMSTTTYVIGITNTRLEVLC